MAINRRNWLKQISLGTAGIGLAGLNNFTFAEEAPLVPPSKAIRLVANENPYGPSPMARKAMAEAITSSNRYGSEFTNSLKTEIAQQHQLTADNILMGAGSTQILEIVGLYAAVQKGSSILPQPTFDYFTFCSEKSGLRRIELPANAEKKVDLQQVLSAIQPDTKLIYVCNPNNPTGTLCDADSMIAFIEEATKKSMVLVDEAYIEFTDEPSVCRMVASNKNLVVAKTFSKIYGLAGARIGYALAHPDTIKQLAEFTAWPNGSHSVVATAAAIASLKDKAFVKQVKQSNQQNREYTISAMEKIGIKCIPSHTNFIYFSLANYPKDFFEQLKNNNIIGTRIYEEAGKWSRITVGTKPEMEQFIKAIG